MFSNKDFKIESETMGLKKCCNSFYRPVLPVKYIKDLKKRTWRIVDANDVILAKNLTEKTAKIITASMNYIDETLNLLRDLYKYESIVKYDKRENLNNHQNRDKIVQRQWKLLQGFGLLDVKQDYHQNLVNYFTRLNNIFSD